MGIDDQQAPSAATVPPPTETRPTRTYDPPRSTVPETWAWMWKDILIRVVPLGAAAGLYAYFSGRGLSAIGLSSDNWLADGVLGVALSVPMLAVTLAFRRWDVPWFRLPTVPDQALQTAFYLGLNGPVEELFWRGTVQSLAILGLGLALPSGLAVTLGWAFATAVFGGYHRLGNWRWRSIAGVTAAGGAFGLLYLALLAQHRSILPVIIVHGVATAGYLSWGDVALHQYVKWKLRRQPRT